MTGTDQDILIYHSCTLIREGDSKAVDKPSSDSPADSVTKVCAADAAMHMGDNWQAVNGSSIKKRNW